MTVGKFANIAVFTRIGPIEHPKDRASQNPFLYRFSCCWPDAADEATAFTARFAQRMAVGPDCWIAHDAVVRPEVTVEPGAAAMRAVVIRQPKSGNPGRKPRENVCP